MERIRSKADNRLIIEAEMNGKNGYFLVDTGASVGLISKRIEKEYNLKKGRKYSGTLIGAGGEIKNVFHCDTPANFKGRIIPQFLFADIDNVIKSIRRETGVEIVGIISLPQLKIARLGIDADDMEIIIE